MGASNLENLNYQQDPLLDCCIRIGKIFDVRQHPVLGAKNGFRYLTPGQDKGVMHLLSATGGIKRFTSARAMIWNVRETCETVNPGSFHFTSAPGAKVFAASAAMVTIQSVIHEHNLKVYKRLSAGEEFIVSNSCGPDAGYYLGQKAAETKGEPHSVWAHMAAGEDQVRAWSYSPSHVTLAKADRYAQWDKAYRESRRDARISQADYAKATGLANWTILALASMAGSKATPIPCRKQRGKWVGCVDLGTKMLWLAQQPGGAYDISMVRNASGTTLAARKGMSGGMQVVSHESGGTMVSTNPLFMAGYDLLSRHGNE